ncbi:ArnT family glycosyltransferase [Negadavirga shengliensis]|uniref:ArnT family glycosyltransferase n=1 Tax=Negadavirga shengliensis TaxID=1389218 RepID=A0ABV9SXA2_9BACT
MQLFLNPAKTATINDLLLVKFLSLTLLSLGYLFGAFVPLFENDPAHHANIALHMLVTGDYLSLVDKGLPYMDKPHLLFWTAALSFKTFGVNTFAYKLPTLLASILGLYATYKVGSLLYNKKVGGEATLLLSVAFAFSLAHSDVRMDGMLTSFMIFSFWQLIRFHQQRTWETFFLAVLGLSLGFMTKGMIGPAVPVIGFLFYLLEERDWRVFLDQKLWLMVPGFLVFSFPVLYAYYVQFDLHPELEIRGTDGNSGVYFILLGQNFERFGGEMCGSAGGKDPYFFLHTILWSVLPWSVLLYLGLGNAVKCMWNRERSFRWSIWAMLIFLVSIYSMSNFKLPHYVVTLIPFMGLVTADYLNRISLHKVWRKVNLGLLSLVLLLVLGINVVFFPASLPLLVFILLALLVGMYLAFKIPDEGNSFFYKMILLGASVNFLMQGNFYPKILQYQAGDNLAHKARTAAFPHEEVLFYGVHSFAFDFYTSYLHRSIEEEELQAKRLRGEQLYLYTNSVGRAQLENSGQWDLEILEESPNFHVSRLKGKFINPKTRHEVTDVSMIIKISPLSD